MFQFSTFRKYSCLFKFRRDHASPLDRRRYHEHHLARNSEVLRSIEEGLPVQQSSFRACCLRCCVVNRILKTMKSCLAFLVAIAVLSLIGYKAVGLGLSYHPACSQSPESRHAILFDAGSTGSRIHIFTFTNNSGQEGSSLALESEYYEEVKPGLSSYADNPLQAAFSLIPLLGAALKKVPQERWPGTPILLKATAGLRLLNETQRKAILSEVERLFRQYPFMLGDGYVSMLSGEDEGICGWITINFLLERIEDKNSAVVLDMGGASAQVTFSPHCPETYSFSPPGHLVERRYKQDSHLALYAHSYLGLGLMATRHSILRKTSPPSPQRLRNGTVVLESPCFHEGEEVLWKYGLERFLVKTKEGFDHAACSRIISSFVQGFYVHQPCEMRSKEVVAISEYYDRAVDLGLLGHSEMQGSILIEDFKKAAAEVCETPRKDQPFLCLDSSYILALLTDGLGLTKDRHITVSKRMNGVETSWGLGAGFQALYNNL